MAEPPQPTSLNILQSIEALGKMFNAMLQTSGDYTEALHMQIETQVDALDEQWVHKFANMEAKIWQVDIRSTINTVNLDHMAGAIKAFNRTGKMSMFHPPDIQSIGLPFGPLLVSWLP